MKSREQDLYDRVVVLTVEAAQLVDAVMEMSPTIELCVFAGKLSGALDILTSLKEAGPPVHDEDEESHPLGRDS